MITAYRRPELLIRQEVEQLGTFLPSRLNAVIIGPDYHSERFGRDPIPEYKNYAGMSTSIMRRKFDGSFEPLDSNYEIGSTADVICWAAEGAQAYVTQQTKIIGGSWTVGSPALEITADVEVSGDSYDPTYLADQILVGDTILFTADSSFARESRVTAIVSSTQFKVDQPFAPASSSGTITGTFTVVRRGDFKINNATIDTDARTVTFADSTTLELNNATVDAYKAGTAFIEYKALRKPAVDETPVLVTYTSSLVSRNMESELGYGVYSALQGSGGHNAVYAVRTAGDTLADFATALDLIKFSDQYYLLVPMTVDDDIMRLVESHVDMMAAEDVKNFRRAYLGRDSFQAKTFATTVTIDTQDDSKLTLDEADLAAALGTDQIKAGDHIAIANDTTDYVVAGLDAGTTREDANIWVTPTPTGAAGAELTVTRFPAVSSVANDMIDFAESIDNRRVSVIWTAGGDCAAEPGMTQPNRFLAAEVAGLRIALPPQQGMTRQTVNTISSSSGMYSSFSPELQDKMAAHGLMLITQRYADDAVFIRHQITSETDDGPLAYEDSIGVNFDMITFGIKDITDKFIGKFSGSADTLKMIREEVTSYMDSKLLSEIAHRDAGPPIAAYRNLDVGLHPVLKDQFYVNVEMDFVLPLNRGVVTLKATLHAEI